ncbi:MAG: TetR/AcrR family transcriptional regulator [Chakrabartia sp.]
MRYQPDHKQEARTRMIEAAGRGFRRSGFGGIGVDGLAKEAGVTSGAFYGHFKSKQAAFREALLGGVDELRSNILALQADHGDAWLETFVDLYLREKRLCALDGSCALQSLTPDVQRADPATKAAFEERAARAVEAIAQGLKGEVVTRDARAWALLSLLTGAVTMARAVADEAIGTRIAEGARAAAIVIAAG